MWDTTDWSCQHITNPPGLWIQSACWAPDNRTLVYSMCGKSDIHALFLKGNKVDSILDVKLQSTPTTTVKTTAGKSVQVGGVIRDMSMDTRNGQRLAVCYEGSPLIALYSVKKVSQVEFDFNSMLFPM
jgi:aladin